MKKKKARGLFGTNKRRINKKVKRYEEEYSYDEYDDEYEEEYYEEEYDDEEYYDEDSEEYYDDEYYDDEYYDDEYYDEETERSRGFVGWLRSLTAFDVILFAMGIVLLAAGGVAASMYFESQMVEAQIEAIVPLGEKLSNVGYIGENGIESMEEILSGQTNSTQEQDSVEIETETETTTEILDSASAKVNVTFTSTERDLKIQFTDATTGELIKGTVFEVELTNTRGKSFTVYDKDMDGVIYATNVNAGNFQALITSTDKYRFPTTGQTVVVKDKIEYVVINVQDEIKTESQVNVAVEDTEKQDAKEEEVILKDTVEWVESGKQLVAGTGVYTLINKDTIPDPTLTASAMINRLTVVGLNVTLNQSTLDLFVGKNALLEGTSFQNSREDNVEYQYTVEWKSSDEKVATVDNGKVTAHSPGKATISYTVTRKTITTVEESVEESTETTESTEGEEATEIVESTEAESSSVTESSEEASSETASESEVTESEELVASASVSRLATTEVIDTATATCEVTVTKEEIKPLELTIDITEATMEPGKELIIDATIKNYKENSAIIWKSSDEKIATVSLAGVVKAVATGDVIITAETQEKDLVTGKAVTASCKVKVVHAATSDTDTTLTDEKGNTVYIKDSKGNYIKAVYADYFAQKEFYIKIEAKYHYTGWQTINGKTYFYDKSGKPVTGAQVIQGVTYNFGADGSIQNNINGTTFGIDVSKHNGKIDWNAVKSSGVDFAIIRCGYRGSSTGAMIEDPKFHANIKGALAAGIKVGIYFFSQAVDEVEAVKEASMAVSLAKNYNLSYPIFIDTESSGGRGDKISVEQRTAVVNAFCKTVQDAGYQAGVYSSKTWFEKKINTSGFGNYTIWLAHYADVPNYAGRFDMWQYSCKGTINGINGKVDLNYSYLGY